jgi:hypothetical protein
MLNEQAVDRPAGDGAGGEGFHGVTEGGAAEAGLVAVACLVESPGTEGVQGRPSGRTQARNRVWKPAGVSPGDRAGARSAIASCSRPHRYVATAIGSRRYSSVSRFRAGGQGQSRPQSAHRQSGRIGTCLAAACLAAAAGSDAVGCSGTRRGPGAAADVWAAGRSRNVGGGPAAPKRPVTADRPGDAGWDRPAGRLGSRRRRRRARPRRSGTSAGISCTHTARRQSPPPPRRSSPVQFPCPFSFRRRRQFGWHRKGAPTRDRAPSRCRSQPYRGAGLRRCRHPVATANGTRRDRRWSVVTSVAGGCRRPVPGWPRRGLPVPSLSPYPGFSLAGILPVGQCFPRTELGVEYRREANSGTFLTSRRMARCTGE